MVHSPNAAGGLRSFINDSNRDGGADPASSSSSSSSSATGYWEPHTSSIDFCESNYLLTDLIVEPHNVLSSLLGLSLFGVAGMLYGNPTNERRTFMIYFTLSVIGLGSACLHASLHWCFQSFDELPMIYLVVCALYCILEVDSPKNAPKYPNLATYLILLSCINTAIYYTFQHLYIIFLLTFEGLGVIALCLSARILWRLYTENKLDEKRGKAPNGNNVIALRFYALHLVVYILIASPVWVLDQLHCRYFLPVYNGLPFPLRGMTLHVVWHACAGAGCHFFVQSLCACRASALGMECDTRCVLGVLPVVIAKPAVDSKQTV
ncbi:hypothetical protein ACHAWF_008004 [Thalassiosira exigua]